MDRETWWATVYGVAKSQIRLSDFTSRVISGWVVLHPLPQLPGSPFPTISISGTLPTSVLIFLSHSILGIDLLPWLLVKRL